jgi:2-methylcitrate dehydratase PrpD
MDAMEALIKHVCRTTYEDLPEDIVMVTKKSVIDTLGVIIAGSSLDGCRLLVDYIRDWGGRGESTIAVFGDKVPCALAAQANGAMARAYEIDDVLDTVPLHPSAYIVPTCLAVAERQGAIDGKSFIAAAALGHDLIIRLAHSIKISPILSGRYNLFEVLAIAGSAGKLMNLNEAELLNAVGIAYSQLVGDGKAARDGAMTSYIQQGTKSKSAIEAALMAAKGITGTRDVLEGPGGFYSCYEPNPDTGPIYSQLGVSFGGAELAVKLHSACRCTHQAIDLAETARSRGLSAKDIDHITVKVNDQSYKLVCSPDEQKKRPKTPVDAMFSIPYTVAAAITRGRVFIDEVNEEAIKDLAILKLAERVTTELDPERQSELSVGSVAMEIKTVSGETVVLMSGFPRGNPRNPATMEDCIQKFKTCVAHSAKPFSQYQVERIAEVVTNLEQLESVNELCDLLVPTGNNG